MKKIICLTFLILFFICTIGAYQKIVDYDIRVDFNPETKIIKGVQTIFWKNSSEKQIDELYFHMYLNAFKNEKSTHLRELKTIFQSKSYFETKDESGFQQINLIKVNQMPVSSKMFVQPDDKNSDDETVLMVKLPFMVQPQETVEIYIEFTAKLPELSRRTGFKGKYFMVAQWFPKLGVLEKDGTWNCHQFHANSEFYADFGDYNVSIIIPREYVVAGAGVRTEKSKIDDKYKKVSFISRKVHDFVWSAYPFYVLTSKKIKKDNPVIDTQINLYTYNNDSWAIKKYMETTEWALEFFSKKYGPYPYPIITVIDPPPGAISAGGMEYPTFITGGRYSNFMSKYFANAIEMVTFHEFGHQYWYGMVGSNEFENAWIDEGLTTFSEIVGIDEKLGKNKSMIHLGNLILRDLDFNLIQINSILFTDPIDTKSWKYFNGRSYSSNSYNRMAMTLFTLKNIYGEEKFWKGMRTFFENYKFKHPGPEDFFTTMEEAMGIEAGHFLRQFVKENRFVDFGIKSVKSSRGRVASGLMGGKFVKQKNEENSGSDFNNFIALLNHGNTNLPVEIKVNFEKGESRIIKWDDNKKWKNIEFSSPSKINSVEIDPDRKITLDGNLLNNSKKLKVNKKPSRFFASTLSFFSNLIFSVFPL